jgi:hypothetical protein
MGGFLDEKESMKRLKLAYCIAAIAVILGGMAIYVFFRDNKNMLLFHFFPKLAFMGSLYFPVKVNTIWSNMFLFNLPYGLWCLSGLLFIRAIWLSNTKWVTIYSFAYLVMVMSFVFLKLPGIIPGTFDALDLVFPVSFAFMESLFFYVFVRRKIVCWTEGNYRI